MHSFARLITLPLLLGTMNLMAFAEAVSPEQATELLAKSQTIDSKCNFLNASDHGLLSNLVARAEIALASQQSVADASAALARGKDAGKITTCSEIERAEVSSILGAAQIALAQVHAAAPELQVEPAPAAALATVAPIVPAPIFAKKAITLKLGVKKLNPNLSSGLTTYASLTQRYYLQRRCGAMGSHAINALYQNVVATHQRTLLIFGKASTAAAMRRAEALAATQTCS